MEIIKDKLYTLQELADILRCTKISVYNFRKEGRFKYISIGRSYLVLGAEVDYIKAHGLRPVTASYKAEARKIKREQRARAKARG